MNKKQNQAIGRRLAWLLTFILVMEGMLQNAGMLTARAEEAGSGAAQKVIEVTQAEGYAEGAYAEWKPVDGADGYLVYVSQVAEQDGTSQEVWTQIDDELIRSYGDYIRADALGLTEGTWYLKIVAGTFDSERKQTGTVAEVIKEVIVTAHDRSGYAWVNGTASGAYNEDGSLKEDARVIYITEETKDTVKLEVEGASANPCVGLQAIMNGYKNAQESRPLAVRIIGNITNPKGLNKGDLLVESSIINKPGITIEGVGEDAVINGWGISITNSSNVEVRNLGFMNCNSEEKDNVSLLKNNDHIWVHNCDMFYGEPGNDSDQKKGDGALDCKMSDYVTFSYNHFWDSGKCNLLGLEEGNGKEYHITYHHNWYDHSDSRHPRVRFYTAHIYNNYYDGNSKYGIGGAQGGGSIFAENNYFRNCKYPMIISMQGSDVWGGSGNDYDKSTLSQEDGSLIKAFGNYMEGAERFVAYEEQDDPETDWDESVDFDAYVAKSREETVPKSVKTVAASETVVFAEGCTGSNTYNNFDTADDFYAYEADSVEAVPKMVIEYAGRLNGGDFRWDFDNNVADTSDSIDEALKAALKEYTSKLKSVGGIMGASTKIYCTVTFDPGNGEAVTEVPVEVNQPVAQPENPTKIPEGKVSFNGWYNGDAKWDFSDKVAGDMTLVGKWYAEGEEPGEIFHGGTPIGTEEVLHDITQNGLSSKYFAITGEQYTKNGTSAKYGDYNNGESYKGHGLIMNSSTRITFSTTTQAAKLVLLTHAGSTKQLAVDGITYQPSEENTGVVEVELEAGEHVVTGKDSDYLFVIIVIPSGEIVTPPALSDYHTVTVDPADGSPQTILSVKKGAALTGSVLTAPTREGYQFTGWVDKGGSSIMLPYVPTGNLTVTATWLATASDGAAEHTVSFNAMGGLSVPSQTVKLGAVCKENEATTARAGYRFIGWYKDYDCTELYDFSSPVNADNMLFAGWSRSENAGAYLELDMKELPVRTYAEEFDWNGFTLHASSDKSMSVDASSVTVPDENATSGSAAYSQRLKLSGTGNTGSRSISFTVSAPATLTLVAASGSSGTKRTLVVNGGQAGSQSISEIDGAAKYTKELTAGTWSVYSSGSGINIYYISVDGEGATDPDAGTGPIGESYAIRIDAGDGSAVKTIVLTAGGQLAEEDFPTPTKEGYTFQGWIDEGGEAITIPYTPAKNMTIRAKWQENAAENSYVITIDKQDGTDPEEREIKAGTELTEEDLPSTLTREGYTFLGWIDDKDETITVPYTPAKSMTIKAKWQEILYVITIDKQDGKDPEEKEIKAGTELTEEDLPSTLTKEGYTFQGWVDEEGKAITVPYTPTKSMTIKAKWQINTTKPKIGLQVELAESNKTYVYTGSAIKPAIIVTNNGETLIEGVDYTVKYSNNVKACEWGEKGDALQEAPKNAPKITVTGKGNFSGSTSENFRIARKSIGEADDAGGTASVKAGAVTVAKNSKATPVLVYNGVKLGAKDYTYDDPTQKNQKFGDASKEETETFEIVLNGTGNYTGSRKVIVKAVKKDDLKTFTVTVGKVDLTYNGQPQLLPAGTVTVKDKKDKTHDLTEHIDYEIMYGSDTTSAGTVKFSVVGIGDYTGTVTKTYKIKPLKSNSQFYVDQAKASYDYNSAGVTLGQDLKVYYGSNTKGTKLQEGTDYKVTYSSNKKVGRGKYTISFLGNFKGSKKTGEFDIVEASLKDSKAEVEAADKVFKRAGVYKSAPIVTINGVALKSSDYKVEYGVEDSEGKVAEWSSSPRVAVEGTTVKVKVTGKGNYKAEEGDCVYGEYQVCDKGTKTDLSSAKVTFYEKNADGTKGNQITKFDYTGRTVEPYVVVTINGQELTPTVDYTVRYVNNKNKGKATVIITAKDGSEYVGSKTATFSIVAKNLKPTGLLDNLFKLIGK